MPRDMFGFYKGFILCNFKNPKDISCKISLLSILRLWIFGTDGPFKSVTMAQKWAKKRCFPLFSDFLTMILDFSPPKTYLSVFIATKDKF